MLFVAAGGIGIGSGLGSCIGVGSCRGVGSCGHEYGVALVITVGDILVNKLVEGDAALKRFADFIKLFVLFIGENAFNGIADLVRVVILNEKVLDGEHIVGSVEGDHAGTADVGVVSGHERGNVLAVAIPLGESVLADIFFKSGCVELNFGIDFFLKHFHHHGFKLGLLEGLHVCFVGSALLFKRRFELLKFVFADGSLVGDACIDFVACNCLIKLSINVLLKLVLTDFFVKAEFIALVKSHAVGDELVFNKTVEIIHALCVIAVLLINLLVL